MNNLANHQQLDNDMTMNQGGQMNGGVPQTNFANGLAQPDN